MLRKIFLAWALSISQQSTHTPNLRNPRTFIQTPPSFLLLYTIVQSKIPAAGNQFSWISNPLWNLNPKSPDHQFHIPRLPLPLPNLIHQWPLVLPSLLLLLLTSPLLIQILHQETILPPLRLPRCHLVMLLRCSGDHYAAFSCEMRKRERSPQQWQEQTPSRAKQSKTT